MSREPRLIAKHRLAFAAIVPVLLVISLASQPPLIWQLIALGPLVAVLGLPHGALDHRVASALWPLVKLRDHAIFIGGYLGLAIVVLVLWTLQPRVALAAFLIYSALHFADDWRAELGLWQSLPLGVSVIAFPALVFQSDVEMLFGLLTSAPTAIQFANLLNKSAIPAIIVSAICLISNFRRAPWVVVEYALLVATALVTPPLIYFVIYFCGLHSPRHFLLTADQLGLTPAQGMRAASPIMMATLIFSAFGAVAVHTFTPAYETATLQLVFIGLAAVTVPHMLLTAVFKSVHR